MTELQDSLWDDAMPPSRNGAVIDETGKYRYSLWRVWDEQKPRVLFIMLNPSTADADQDDPTLRRCISFAKSWNYGSLEVVNLFAYRATRPRALDDIASIIGPENDRYIQEAIARAERIVCAWGSYKHKRYRDLDVLFMANGRETYCLGCTQEGLPLHPLYVPADTQLMRYM